MELSAIDEVVAEIDAWSVRQDAFYSDTYCEALGFL
jgi:hypothetical protein